MRAPPRLAPPRPGTALSAYIGFVDFIINMAPGVIMASVVCMPLILFLYRHTLVPPIQRYTAMLEEVGLPASSSACREKAGWTLECGSGSASALGVCLLPGCASGF